MSKTRIVKGKYTKLTAGEYRMFSERNIISSSGKKYFEKGEGIGIIFGSPKKL